jgi:dinuclear metal center YbgI/SA1388 family protein
MNSPRTRPLSELIDWLEQLAPTRWAESWDNVGLLLGDPAASVQHVLTCLTITPEVVDQAVQLGAELIVSHHPILFRPVQRIRADARATADVWRLARAGVAVYSPHTAYDNAPLGINQRLASALGLERISALVPAGPPSVAAHRTCKLVVFCPEADRPAVLSAAFAAGAGQIGAYRECSFTTTGEGTFWGTESANPTIGQIGRRESVCEGRVELVAPVAALTEILRAIRRAHSYEEPAIDVYPMLPDRWDHPGVGRVGDLPVPLDPTAFVDYLRERLELTGPIELVLAHDRPIRRVAIACGAGDGFVAESQAARADLLMTGEARFHHRLDARRGGVHLALIGHFASEHAGITALGRAMSDQFPDLRVSAAAETDPTSWFSGPQ